MQRPQGSWKVAVRDTYAPVGEGMKEGMKLASSGPNIDPALENELYDSPMAGVLEAGLEEPNLQSTLPNENGASKTGFGQWDMIQSGKDNILQTEQQESATQVNTEDDDSAYDASIAEQSSAHTTENANGLTSMPPPAAPASMLWSLRPSDKAKATDEQIDDPFICGRLISVAVILFRQGKAKEAKALGQYTIDLIGNKAWTEELPTYMEAPPLADDKQQTMKLLQEVAATLRLEDLASAASLDGMIYLIDQN